MSRQASPLGETFTRLAGLDDLPGRFGPPGEPDWFPAIALADPAAHHPDALVMPNGCGKSTLLRGMSRLLRPAAGAVHLDSQAIHTMKTKELAQQTDVLLLDEPTIYLDLAYQIDVLEDLNQVARYADHIVALRGGQIVAQGTPEEVMTAETIREVFGLYTQIITDPISGTLKAVHYPSEKV